MKKLFFAGMILCFGLTSCSREKDSEMESKKAILSFETILNNLNEDDAKELALLPDCSPEIPAFVELILSKDGQNVLGTRQQPFIIDLKSSDDSKMTNSGKGFVTKENQQLELEEGNYVLDYFSVLDSNKKLIWIAPTNSEFSPFQYFVRQPLPFPIKLVSGSKKYVDVEVLCFDNRLANQYGYDFLKVAQSSTIEFCIFGNICDANGRHDILPFKVNGWKYSGNPSNPKGEVLFTDKENGIIVTDYEDYAETSETPACVELPDLINAEDLYYLEIRDSGNKIIRSGVISDTQVKALYTNNGHVNYYHFREGNCNLEDSPNLFPSN